MYFTSVKALQRTFPGFFVIVLFSPSNFIERKFAVQWFLLQQHAQLSEISFLFAFLNASGCVLEH